MKALLCAIALLLLASYSFGQKIPRIYQISADTVRIYNTCDTAELVLENRTKDTLGFLFNKGKGRTEFRRLQLGRIGASQLSILGQDTIDMDFSTYGDTRYIQNQTTADQPSSGFRITGTGRSNSQFQVVKDGSNSIASTFQLYNAASTGGANIQLDINTNPGLNFWVHDGTTWQNRLTLAANGTVGIGTTSPIGGVHIINNTTGLMLQSTRAFATTSGGLYGAYNTGTPTAANQRLGGIIMGTITNGTELRVSSQIDVLTSAAWTNDASQPSYMRFMTTAVGGNQPTERMRIDAAGNVGIGISNPTVPLHVNGAAAVASLNGLANAPLQVTSGSSAQVINLMGGGTGAQSNQGGAISIFGGVHATQPGMITFYTGTGTGGTQQPERMRIDATGKVGIGTTAPSTTLHVNGTFKATGVADVGNTSMLRGTATGAGNYAYMRFTNSNGDRLGYIGDPNNAANDMYLTADSGNVRLVPQNGTGGSLNVQPNTMDYNGGQLYLTNGTSNLLLFNNVGIEKPTFSTRSKGTRITLWPGVNASAVDYAMGIDTSHMWSSVPLNNTTVGFKWYGGTTQIARLDGTGNLTLVGQLQATSVVQTSLRSLKKDIQPFSVSALKIFEKAQVRTFKFKADATGKTNIGFIADEVPDEMATPQRNGVDQTNTMALLVKAVQELTAQNKALQDRISQLEARMKEK